MSFHNRPSNIPVLPDLPASQRSKKGDTLVAAVLDIKVIFFSRKDLVCLAVGKFVCFHFCLHSLYHFHKVSTPNLTHNLMSTSIET